MGRAPFLVADDTYVLPATLPVPGKGLQQHFNPLLIRGREPILVDTSAAVLRDEYLRPVAHGRTAELCDMLVALTEDHEPVSFPSRDDGLVQQ